MGYDVVGFGETMLRFSPSPGARLEDASIFHAYVAGAESNVLACLARLGARCAWASALPSNPLGRRVASELRRHGVDTSGVVWMHNGSRLGVYYAEESAMPLGVQVQYDREHSACALVHPDSVDLAILDHARLLHLTGITPALKGGAREVFRRFLHHARDGGTRISFDVNYRAKMWNAREAAAGIEEACRAAHLLFCTGADAAALWDFTGEPRAVLEKMSNRFGGDNAEQTIILTVGREGAVHLSGGNYDESPAFPSEGTSRFGSGDAFAAGYIAAYLKTSRYCEICEGSDVGPLRFGNAVAALKRCIAGDVATITPDDVRGVLQRREGGHFR